MTRADDLKKAAASLDDKHGRGGKFCLARLLDWSYSTLYRKLNGELPIYKDDILAAKAAAEEEVRKRSGAT